MRALLYDAAVVGAVAVLLRCGRSSVSSALSGVSAVSDAGVVVVVGTERHECDKHESGSSKVAVVAAAAVVVVAAAVAAAAAAAAALVAAVVVAAVAVVVDAVVAVAIAVVALVVAVVTVEVAVAGVVTVTAAVVVSTRGASSKQKLCGHRAQAVASAPSTRGVSGEHMWCE